MKPTTRKGLPGRPIGFARRASAALGLAREVVECPATWADVVEGLRASPYTFAPSLARYVARLVQREGYNLSDEIPSNLIRKGDQLRRRSELREQRKVGAR